jgi:hypothetical protein
MSLVIYPQQLQSSQCKWSRLKQELLLVVKKLGLCKANCCQLIKLIGWQSPMSA